jgi:hypothetical protein
MQIDIASGRPSNRPLRLVAAVAGLAVCLVGQAALHAGHPYHVCVGEMDWNAERGRWEVALRLHPSDLQTAISQLAGRRMELDGSPEVERWVLRYLCQHFGWVGLDEEERPRPLAGESAAAAAELGQRLSASSQPSPPEEAPVAQLSWLGSELEKGWMWLYFELPPPVPPETAEGSAATERQEPPLQLGLRHSLLLDLVEDQTNTLVVRVGTRRQTLRFTAQRRQRLMPSWPESPGG